MEHFKPDIIEATVNQLTKSQHEVLDKVPFTHIATWR